MSMELFFPDSKIRQRHQIGPLATYIDGFAARLASHGYAFSNAKEKLRLVGALSRWLGERNFGADALDEQQISTFLVDRQRTHVERREAATCRQLLSYLRDVGRIDSAPQQPIAEGPVDRIERAYRRYLVRERGLAMATLDNYLPIVRAFLSERFGGGRLELETLVPQDVNRFLLHHARRFSRTRAKLMVTALRSFLRFLRQRGDIDIDLASAVPTMINWRLPGLPKSLPPEQVETLLACCDRSTPAGRRDYAILLLLARLGLRAGEVVAMTLDDVDWEAGVLTVRGKGQRHEQLPLPADVGQALVRYLREGRPSCTTRRLFVRLNAPRRGFGSSASVCDVVRRALARAQLDPPTKGAHLLRHSLATGMLRHGASLEDIGQVLRHRHPDTTQIYAKVDLNALRALAQPWPGGAT